MPNFAANLTMMFNEVDFLDRFSRQPQALGLRALNTLFPYDYEAAHLAEKTGSSTD